MDLMWIVYFVSLLNPLNAVLSFAYVVFFLTAVCILFAIGIHKDSDTFWTNKNHQAERKDFRKKLFGKFKFTFTAAVITMLLSIFIPSEKTAYMMVGANVAQRVYDSPETKQVTEKVLKIVNGKLDSYVNEIEKQTTK